MMKINRLNEKITIQKNAASIDEIGNHKNTWTDYFTCHSYVSTYGSKGDEEETTGVVVNDNPLIFTIRYSSETSVIDSTHYRVIFRNDIYNITKIDMMNYQHESIKLTCSKERENYES